MKNAWQSVFGLYFNGLPCRVRAGEQLPAEFPFILLGILRRVPHSIWSQFMPGQGQRETFVHARCDMTWQSLVTFCWCNNVAAVPTGRHVQPQQFHCLQSDVQEEVARWRFLRLGCGCGQEAVALAKLDSTDKSPGCRAPYGLQLQV